MNTEKMHLKNANEPSCLGAVISRFNSDIFIDVNKFDSHSSLVNYLSKIDENWTEHHIDLNHNNNAITNRDLSHKSCHRKYHKSLEE